MIIDRTHVKWAGATAAATVAVVTIYFVARPETPFARFGGTGIGITYGALAMALIVAAALLGLRQRVPAWRVGRMQTWMRAHLWLGVLSLPIVFIHGGFSFGHGITLVLMVLFTVTTLSGLFGVAVQNYLPRQITRAITAEVTFEQIGRVCDQLLKEAEEVVTKISAPAQPAAQSTLAAAADSSGVAVAEAMRSDPAGDAPAILRSYWESEIAPFLRGKQPGRRRTTYSEAQQALAKLRLLLPAEKLAGLGTLQELCDERAQLDDQLRLHYWLHAWLYVHVPLSYAMLALAVVHAITSLRY